MSERKHPYFSRQIDGIAQELSMLAIACGIELGQDGLAERMLKGDESVCTRKNPEAFQKARRHLMALFSVEEDAIERLGAAETKEMLDKVRAAITDLRREGSPTQSVPRHPR